MNTHPFVLAVASLSSVVSAQTTLPWHRPDAVERIVYSVRTSHAVRDAAVALPLPTSEGCVFVDAAAPDAVLPVFDSGSNAVLRLPGPLSTNQARLVVAYFGCGANVSPRPPFP